MLPLNNPEKVESETENNEFDRETPEERYVSPEQKQQIIDKLRLI